MFHKDPERQPSVLHKKPSMRHQKSSATPVQPYEVVDGVNGGQYFGHTITKPGLNRAMSSEGQTNGQSFGNNGSQGKLEREDSNNSNSTPRSAKKSHRMSFPWFGSRRRKGSTSSAADGQGADGKAAQPKLDISDEDIENNDDVEIGETEYPYAYDNAHGYHDANSYYYPGQTAYSNDAIRDDRGPPSRAPNAARNQHENQYQGNVTSGTGNSQMSGGNGSNNNNYGNGSGNGNGNGNGNHQNQSNTAPSRRRQSIGHASPLNEIQEDEYEYYGVAPAKPYQGVQHGVGSAAPQRKPTSQSQYHVPGQGQVEGVTSPPPVTNVTSNPYSPANPLTQSVMRQQMQKKEWMAQQEQQQLSQFIPDPTQEPMRRQSVPRTASGNEASQPPLPLPLPQLHREPSYNNHQRQQQEQKENIPRVMSPEQDDDLDLMRTKSVPSVSVNPLGQHPLLREQSFTIPSPMSATPEHTGFPQPPGLPPKEPLSRGGSANPQGQSVASTSKIPLVPGSAAVNNATANNGNRRNSLGKAPGQLPQFSQQQHAHQRFLRDQGGTGKALSPYTPQSMYTMSSTPDIPQRDGRRSIDNHAAEVDPMGMWQPQQQHHQPQIQQQDYAEGGIHDGTYQQGGEYQQDQPQRHSYEQNTPQPHSYNQTQQQRHSYEEYQPHPHSQSHSQNYGWGPAQQVHQYEDYQHKSNNERQHQKPYLEHQPRSFLQQQGREEYDPLMQDQWPQQRELYEVQQERQKEQQQHLEAQQILGLKSPVDQRLQSPNHSVMNANKSRAQTTSDVGIANLEPQKAQQHQSVDERSSQWPLTPMAMPIVTEAVVSPLKPKSDWDRSCMEYFMRKYRERLDAKNWEKEPFRDIMGVPPYPSESHHTSLSQLIGTASPSIGSSPSTSINTKVDDIFPHLLHDRLFYLAYAIVGTSKSTYSHILWELFGTNPGHLLTIYAAIASTNGPPNVSEPMDLDQYLCAAIEGRKTSTATGKPVEKAEEVSMEGLLNMVTRRLDEPGTSPYDFVLRQIKWQLRMMKSELYVKFGAESGWRNRMPLSFSRSDTGSKTTQGLPLYHGLQQYLANQEQIIQKAMLHTCAQLPDLSALLGPSTSSMTGFDGAEETTARATAPPPVPQKLSPYQREPEPEPEPAATVTLLVDAPGSGKTRMMRDKLLSAAEGVGMYLHSPNLPPSEHSDASPDNTLQHARQKQAKSKMTLGVSTRPYATARDTYSLYRDLSYLERSGVGGGRPVLGITDLKYNRLVSTDLAITPLFRGRSLLIGMLEKLEAAAGGRITARERSTTWTQLQMANMAMAAGQGLDVIDLAYRFARLYHGSLASSEQEARNAASSFADRQRLEGRRHNPAVLVIDEAQSAFGDPLAERIIRGMLEQTQAGGHAYVVGSRTLQVAQTPLSSLERELSFSGSGSLQFHHLQELGMKPMKRGKKRDSVIERAPCSWAQVDNSETFWSVLVHHAWSLVGEIFELRVQGFLGVSGGLGQSTAAAGNARMGTGGGMGGDDRGLDEHRRMSIGSRAQSQEQILGRRQSRTSLRAAKNMANSDDVVNKPSLTQSKAGRRSRQLRDIPLLTREGQPLAFDINLPGTSFTSWSEVETTLQQSWNVLSGTERDYSIDKESTRFFGRVRWTATFAEELLRASSMTAGRHVTFETYDSGYGSQQAGNGDGNDQNITAGEAPATNTTRNGGLSRDGVRAAAQRAAGRIKSALRERMDSIRGTRCADELIWAALEIDVFGSSKSFEGPLAADLVAAGFALVENLETPPHAIRDDDAHVVTENSIAGQGAQSEAVSRAANGPVRARLAEPLVVEAIMEYLYESPIQVLDGYLRRFFTPLQTDHADRECLWKIAEDVLAKKLQNTIRFTNDTISQHRRTGFFDILRNSRSPTPIHKLRRRSTMQYESSYPNQHHHHQFSHHDYWTYGEAERFVGSLDRYYLQDSGTNIDRPGEWRVEDWLYETEEEHRPNFFFFDGGDGYGEDMDDDGALGCLFFLTDRENVRRKMLVVLQFAPAPAAEITTEDTSSDGEYRNNDSVNAGHNASPPPDAFPTGTPPQNHHTRSRTPPRTDNQPPPPPSFSQPTPQNPLDHPKPTSASTFHSQPQSPFPTLSNLITSLWSTSLSPPGQPPQTPWPVFYIYVPPPSTEIDDDAFVAELSRSMKDKMPRNHYVGYVDISNSDGIWGTTFPAWIGQMADEKRKGIRRMRRERRRERVGRMGRR